MIFDLGEEKIAVEALRQSQQRLKLIAESLSDAAIYGLDQDGSVSDWNAGAAQLFGLAGDEAISKSFSNLFVPEDRTVGSLENLLIKAQAQTRFETQGQCLRKDGTKFFASILIGPVRDEAGKLAGFAVLTKNLTGKLEAEKTREKLKQSQKMAMLGELTSVVAHDFNNLLAAISGSLELISDENPHPLIDIAKRASDRGTKLTSQLRAFAQAKTVRPQTASLNDLIHSCELLLERAGKGSIVLNLNLSPDLWTCDVDQAEFQSAILNLVWIGSDRISNGGTLTIETRNAVIDAAAAGKLLGIAPGSYATLIVSEALPDSAGDVRLASIDTLDLEADSESGGAVRLNQVYEFAQDSNGHLELVPQPGQGLLTYLYLPKSRAAGIMETAASADAAKAAQRTVLVVDDDPDVLEVTIMKLERLGYAVSSAQDGHIALAILRGAPLIDILFTDLRMPNGMNGIDLARHARALHPSIHIIIASGDPRPALEEIEALQEKISFLAKPYSLPLLAETLRC